MSPIWNWTEALGAKEGGRALRLWLLELLFEKEPILAIQTSSNTDDAWTLHLKHLIEAKPWVAKEAAEVGGVGILAGGKCRHLPWTVSVWWPCSVVCRQRTRWHSSSWVCCGRPHIFQEAAWEFLQYLTCLVNIHLWSSRLKSGISCSRILATSWAFRCVSVFLVLTASLRQTAQVCLRHSSWSHLGDILTDATEIF